MQGLENEESVRSGGTTFDFHTREAEPGDSEFQANRGYVVKTCLGKLQIKRSIQSRDTAPILKQNVLEPRGGRPEAQLLWCGQEVFLISGVQRSRGWRGLSNRFQLHFLHFQDGSFLGWLGQAHLLGRWRLDTWWSSPTPLAPASSS